MTYYNPLKKVALLLLCGLTLGNVAASSSSDDEDWNDPKNNNAREHDGDANYWRRRAGQVLEARGARFDSEDRALSRSSDYSRRRSVAATRRDREEDNEGLLGLLQVTNNSNSNNIQLIIADSQIITP